MRLEGKVATVFAQEGSSVTITGRRREPLDRVAERTGAMAVPGDTSSREDVEAVVRVTVERWGRLDVVVANAGIGLGGSAGEVSDEAWQRTLDVNLTGAMLLVRAALPRLVRRPGAAIVLVSSVSGFLSAPRSAAYEVSKAGLLALMRSAALDYGPLGVRCNAVCPGWIRTPMGDASAEEIAAERGITVDDAYALLNAPVPLRRPGTPEEVAKCCAFLASDEASYVNGAALMVDGGGNVVDVASLPWSSPTKDEATS